MNDITLSADSPPAAVPAELAALDRWCVWRMEPRFAGGDPAKIPYDPRTHRRAKSNDSSTWSTFDAAREAFATGRYAGIGLMLAPPYLGIDLDDCRNPDTGIIVPRAAGIIVNLATYSETSPSGRGVKMIGSGTMPSEDGRGKNYRRDPWRTGAGGIEIYQTGRFFAVTGRRLDGTPNIVADCTAALANLYHELYPPAPPRPVRAVPLDVSHVDRVRRAAAYIARLPASVSGQGGHDRLLRAACVLVRFGVGDADALALLVEFNRRAVPPWGERDIERKWREAQRLAGHERGAMLGAHDRYHARSPRRRTLITTGGEM